MQCVGVLGSDLASSLKVKVWLAASYGLLSVLRDRLGQVSTTMLHMTLMRPLLAPLICAVPAVIVRLTWVRRSSLQKPNRMLISAPLLKYTCPCSADQTWPWLPRMTKARTAWIQRTQASACGPTGKKALAFEHFNDRTARPQVRGGSQRKAKRGPSSIIPIRTPIPL